MPLLARLFVVVLSILIGGCAATVTKPTGTESKPIPVATSTSKVALVITGNQKSQASADWQTFRAEWRSAFTTAASTAGIPFEYIDTDMPANPSPGTTLVRITVNDYRYVSPAARFGFGIMTGNAFVDADADFIELPARRTLGSRKYSTSSSAWQGVFSAMTDKQVLAISNEIIGELKRK